MRALSHAQHVVSKTFRWSSNCSVVAASSKLAGVCGATAPFAIATAIRVVSALPTPHEPYRHHGPPRSNGIAVRSGFSPP
jgi:hypothetical protein